MRQNLTAWTALIFFAAVLLSLPVSPVSSSASQFLFFSSSSTAVRSLIQYSGNSAVSPLSPLSSSARFQVLVVLTAARRRRPVHSTRKRERERRVRRELTDC